jgi:TonB dependent receptor/CarboxypepD_reg-like domain/TonB-dependent Receptor Plug Domain
MKFQFICLFLLALNTGSFGQQKFTISGTVSDKKSGETLIGATVYVKELSGVGTSCNGYGFYSLTLTQGKYHVISIMIGLEADTVVVDLKADTKLDIKLSENALELKEVVISSKKKDDNITKTQMGVEKLDIQEIAKIPVLFGEKDVLKTIQLLPGVKSAGEGSSGFYVRGGGADQNLILLDEATVYNASHLLGFFSTFNSDAIKDLTLYKGSMPAEYGGRLSSVVDIKMNDGNNHRYHANGGIGLIASRLAIEGPIVKDKGSFIVSGRRTYADVFLGLSNDSILNQTNLYFYDLNLKANYKINDKNRVFVSGYFGQDNFGSNNFGIEYGNATGTARFNHIFSSKLFSNTSFIYSNYNYTINGDGGNIKFISKIQDVAVKQDFQYYANSNHKISFGFNVTHHNIAPGILDAAASASYNSVPIQSKFSYESAAYVSQEIAATKKLKLSYGLRLSALSMVGAGTFYNYNVKGDVTDSTTYKTGELIKTYFNLEPRFSANYVLNPLSSVKASYTRNVQNMHLLSNSVSLNPTDLWIPTSLNVKPEIADQVSLGYYRNFDDNKYEFSTEIYYKTMQNQIDYKNGAQTLANENVESELLYGTGRAYGLELFLKKKTGNLSGWISYTLSKTERQIEGINNANWYPAKQDQTHNISIVGIYQASKRWTFSGTWVYNTGNAVTFPSGKYIVNGQASLYYTERNGYRMPAYHRLDFGATLLGKKREKWEGSWTFSCYNVYGRENAYSIAFENVPDNPTQIQAVQTSLFRWVPSVTYNFKF